MRYQNIPNTSLVVSQICLGTALFGSLVEEEHAFDILDRFLDLGGNFIDTAHVYSNWISGEVSRSEKCIGRWLTQRRLHEKVVIGTKGAHPNLDTMQVPRMSRRELQQDLFESLEYLRTEAIDLYWLHRDDPSRPVGEILETLNDFVENGYIRYFGCSNWRVERIQEAQQYAKQHGIRFFAANQMMWSLAAPNLSAMTDPSLVVMDERTKIYHQETQLAAIPYSSQAKGFFTKLASEGMQLSQDIQGTYLSEDNLERMNVLQQLSKEFGNTVTELAIAYLTSQSFPTIPVIGPKNLEQLERTLGGADLILKPDVLERLEHAAEVT